MKNGLIIDEDGTKRWWFNDELHRTDGPAVEYVDGTKEWWVNDKLHRLDGPAFEGANGHKEWLVDDQRHRTDGPAVEYADGSKEWWFEDECWGDDQAGFWALWTRLTPDQQNNISLLQYMAKYVEGVK